MTIRQTTISSLVVAALSLGVAGGVALAAEDSPPSQSPGAPTSGHPSVLTDTECSGVWKDAASGGDVLTGDKAGSYVTDFKQADADQDGNISQAEFSEACKKGGYRASDGFLREAAIEAQSRSDLRYHVRREVLHHDGD